jgi:hypothetical protein
VEVQLAFELVKHFVARVDVKILPAVRAARDEGDKIRILPDHPSLAPAAAILVDPLLQVEVLEVRKHTDLLGTGAPANFLRAGV